MTGVVMFEQEQKIFQDTLDSLDELRNDVLQVAIDNFGDDLLTNFCRGSFGNHEATDRIFIFMQAWDKYVVEHPSVVVDQKAYRFAALAHAFMTAAYQAINA